MPSYKPTPNPYIRIYDNIKLKIMKYYIIYLKALWRNRKELKQMIHSYLVCSGELLEYKKTKMMAQDFTKKVTHEHKRNITEQDVKDYLAGKITITPNTILKK